MDDTGCPKVLGRGHWMCTFTGKSFYPLDPRPEEVCIEDIAHALSNLCRFCGHTREFYSVAQHSVLCAELAEKRELSCAVQQAALMHDAAEAYLCDLPRPLKLMLPDYKVFEDKVQAAIFGALLVPWSHTLAAQVKVLDNVLLATEKRDLMPKLSQSWGPLPEPWEKCLFGWQPKLAEDNFIAKYNHLFFGRRY